MPKIFLNDGRAVVGPEGVSDEQLDAMADLAEKGRPLPQGFTVEGSGPMRELQAQTQPSPLQQMYQAASGPATAARDAATQGVAGAIEGVSGLMPESMGVQVGPLMGQGPAQPVPLPQQAQNMAQLIVPQTPGQAVSRMALLALSGPVAGGIGTGGALSRALLPTMAGQLTESLVGEGVKVETILAEVVPALLSEGAWQILPRMRQLHPSQAGRDVEGNSKAAALGQELAKVSSMKTLKTPEDYRHLLASVSEKPYDTPLQDLISKNIGEAREGIGKALAPALAKMSPTARELALATLEDAAGMEPTMVSPLGAPPSLAKPVNRVFRTPPDTVFKTALQNLADKFQEADGLLGAERHKAFQEYGALRQKLESALSNADPMLAQQFDESNKQFARDIDVRDFLWKMKKEKVWETDTAGAHINPAKFDEAVQDADRLFDKYGLFGGSHDAMRWIAGPGGTPGARSTLHEGYARMFQQMPFSPVSASMGVNPKMMVTPPGQVTGASVRGMTDMLGQIGAQSLLQPMGGP